MPFGGNSVQGVAIMAASTGSLPTNMFGVPTDDAGLPRQPYLTPRGGGGGSDRSTMTYWCFPLPPSGPMTIHADWPDQGFDELSIPLDADVIREAARDAITLWEPDD
jgi:hypothetical protein